MLAVRRLLCPRRCSARCPRSAAAGRGFDRLAVGAHPVHATLMLDFVPNAVHAGIYRALAAGYYKRAGIDLTVIPPGSTSTRSALINAGKIDFALADGIDVAQQIAQGHDAEAIMAIVQRRSARRSRSPASTCTRRRAWRARRSGSPACRPTSRRSTRSSRRRRQPEEDPHRHDRLQRRRRPRGRQDRRLHRLLARRRRDAAGQRLPGHRLQAQPVGRPDYPGLVAFTTQALIREDPRSCGRSSRRRSTATRTRCATRAQPRRPAEAEPVDRAQARAGLARRLPADLRRRRRPYGTLVPSKIAALSSWLLRNHLIAHAVSPQRFGTNAFLP
jgi:putative hydroxymethylpyrimidine transport system substrate-binding protein